MELKERAEKEYNNKGVRSEGREKKRDGGRNELERIEVRAEIEEVTGRG